MNLEPWQREFDVAPGAIRQGAMLARDLRQRIGQHAFLKADRSPVTVADFAVQALVAHRLFQAFPDDPLVAEEDAASLQAPDARLTLQSVLDVLHCAIASNGCLHVAVLDSLRSVTGQS